ncbi:MAG: TIR domain-containing protein [Candidatus Methylomirabilaceae bacterium]
MSDILVERFERYFRHPDSNHEVLCLGDRATGCANVRRALDLLGVVHEQGGSDSDLFDEALEGAVRRFQDQFRNRVSDGQVGPGTRRLIVSNLLGRFDASIFLRLKRPQLAPSVFLSYTWLDSRKVDKLDQWLRDHGIRVIRDQTSFEAGVSIPENIRRAVAEADKVVAVFSAHSKDRDWPRLEKAIAEEVEHRLGRPVLLYVALDDTPLPSHDPTRLAILAKAKALRQVGAEVLHALTGAGIEPVRVEYDETKPL